MRTFGQYLEENAPEEPVMATAVEPVDLDASLDAMVNSLVVDLKKRIKSAIPQREKKKNLFDRFGKWWKDMNDPNYETPYTPGHRMNQNRAAGLHTGQASDLGESVIPIEVYNFFKESAEKICEAEAHDIDSPNLHGDPSRYGTYEFSPNPEVAAAARAGRQPPQSSQHLGPGMTHVGGNYYHNQETGKTQQINPVAQLGIYLDGEFKKKLKGILSAHMKNAQSNKDIEAGNIPAAPKAPQAAGPNDPPTAPTAPKFSDGPASERPPVGPGPSLTDDKATSASSAKPVLSPNDDHKKLVASADSKKTDEEKAEVYLPNYKQNHTAQEVMDAVDKLMDGGKAFDDTIVSVQDFRDDLKTVLGVKIKPKSTPSDFNQVDEDESSSKLINMLGNKSDEQQAELLSPGYEEKGYKVDDILQGAKSLQQHDKKKKTVKQFRDGLDQYLGLTIGHAESNMVDRYKQMLREQDLKGYMTPVVRWKVDDLPVSERANYYRQLMRN